MVDGPRVCQYNDTTDKLLSITIASPTIYARDTTPADDIQKIGWQVITRRTGGGKPTLTFTSDIIKAQSAEDASAAFSPRVFTPQASDVKPSTAFTVIIKMIWYKPTGRLLPAGRSTASTSTPGAPRTWARSTRGPFARRSGTPEAHVHARSLAGSSCAPLSTIVPLKQHHRLDRLLLTPEAAERHVRPRCPQAMR